MTQSGWRKPTPALGVVDHHAQVGEQLSIPKSQALLALKRVAAKVGLKAGDLLLLDTLSAFAQPQDWEAGQRPIVWPSNAYLTERTGFSLSALKRHIRRLAAAGVVAFRDSPNGKRWGRRDHTGRIVEAYGFDLSPLAARAAEFETLFQRLEAERHQRLRLSREITVLRRAISAEIECASDVNAEELHERMQKILSKRDSSVQTLETVCDQLVQLQKSLRGCAPVESERLDTMGANSDPHIQSTRKPQIDCNAAAEVRVALPVLVGACPEFSAYSKELGQKIRRWEDVDRASRQLGAMMGISDAVRDDIEHTLGPWRTTAAITLVFEKHVSGEVTSPAGYLRGMAKKSQAGALHLERSLYGRLAKNAA